MGMFAVDDMAGLDVGWRVRKALGHFSDPRERRPLVHDRLVEMGRLGQKRGKGWYRYDEPRKPTPDPEVEALIRSLRGRRPASRRGPISDEEIVERAIFALVNEGARALEAGVAARASDIDVIYVNGYGFPGLARRAAVLRRSPSASATVLDRIRAFHREHGERWRPAPLLVELAERGRHVPRRADRTRGAADVSPAFEGRLRTPRMLPPDAIVSRDDRGRLRVRSPHALGPYPATLTHCLAQWAERAPDRTFLAARRPDGFWERLTYRVAFERTRSVAQALLDRGLSADRPIVILSGNGLEHAVLGLAAMHAGVPYAPIAPSYSLVSQDHRTLAAVCAAMRPGLIFAAEGERFDRALASLALPDDVEVVTSSPAPGLRRQTSLRRAPRHARRPRRWRTRTPVSGPTPSPRCSSRRGRRARRRA